jgi:hypothetical protein
LELGYSIGAGKEAHILFDKEPERFDLMYNSKFYIEISKKNLFTLSFNFNIYYEWSNGIYEDKYVKDSIKFSYIDKENTKDILDVLCAGLYEKEFEEEFKNSWIDGNRMNSIITNVVSKLDIWKEN